MTSFYKIIYGATPTIGPITSRQLISRYGNAKQTLEAIPELPKRGGRKIQPASAASAQREYEKLTQIGGILLHMVQIAIQNI